MTLARRLTTCAAAALGALALLALPGAAAAKDRNHDRIPDRWEKRHHLSLNVNQAHRDQDSDQLRNRAEFLAGDNPRNADSDGDGIPDGEENAGKIASFDAATGELKITLFNGGSISGTVTESTRIKCEDTHTAEAAMASRGEEEPGDDNGGNNSGPGSENSGPGRGDEDGEGGACTTADLVPGATVEEAELELGNGTATFDEVELAG
jgi:hypothetical protein